MFKLSSNIMSAKSRLIVLLAIVSMILVACDLANAPVDEENLIEGPPEVTIASPLAGDTYNEGVGVNILLRVDNAGEDVARIAIEVDGQIIGEAILPNPDGDASFTVSNGWPAEGEGQHVISAVASRSDGTVSEEASVTINVVASATDDADDSDDEDTDDDAGAQAIENTPIPSPTTDTSQNTSSQPATTAPTATTASTNTPAPTNTPSRPQVRITTGANVRTGPDVAFDPPMGSLAAGATSNIVAVNPAGTWYKIEYYNGEGWVSSVVAEVIGDISGLPREAGPPTPVPATATPLPTETPIPSNVDLSVTNVVISPHPFVCARSSEIRVTVANSGSGNSTETSVVVADIFNGQVTESTNAPVPVLAPGATHTAVLFLTVSTNFNEAHSTRITVDPNGQVSESNENNNVRNEPQYVLAPGSC